MKTNFHSSLAIAAVLILFMFSQTVSFSQNTGTVDTRTYELYILSKPLASYEEIFTVDITSFNIAVPDQETEATIKPIKKDWNIIDKIDEFIRRTKKKDVNKEVEAILYEGGQTASAIKFTSFEKRGKGHVRNETGVDLYVMSKPTKRIKLKKKWTENIFDQKKSLFKRVKDLAYEATTIEYDVLELYHEFSSSNNSKKWPDGIIINAGGKVMGFDYQ